MDRFLNINWNPPLEDMIDNTFMNAERFEKDSVMHKIMTGNYIDPFKNIEEEYKMINTDLMRDINKKVDGSIESIEIKKEKRADKYVPPVKPMFKFPRRSNLTKEQQAMCLRVLLRFSESDKPKITQTEREELQHYMDLKTLISQEQDEFLEFAKSKWHERSLRIVCEDYMKLRWKSKLQYVNSLPRYYVEVTNVPFITDKSVEVKFISVCLQMGQLPKIVLPSFTGPYKLHISSEQLQKRFPPKNYTCNESPVCYKSPVSEDPNCQKLAESNNVDLVISSSGLNCLVNNIGPSYTNSWILPLVIKRHNDKNVIYIDKPAPPNASTVPNKNSWIYKYILKYFLIEHLISENIEEYIGDIYSEEILRLEDEYENASPRVQTKPHFNVSEKAKDNENILKREEDLKVYPQVPEDRKLNCEDSLHGIPDTNISNSTHTKGAENVSSEMNIEDNVSYKLFTIGPQSLEQNELMKNVIKDYKMLVRTKVDGYETLQDNEQKLLLLAPKLEHQIDLGAEAVTLEESLKQWVSLVFRPFTFLARVRILAETSEILQVEHRTAMSVSNEVKRLYNIRVEDSLTVLHNVIQSLTNLSPGRYIMRHTVRNGSFATVYKEVEAPGKNVFDIRTVYDEQFHSLHNPPWIPLDKIVPTPMNKHLERMPVMFCPKIGKKFSKHVKAAEVNKSNTGIRRSLRNKNKKFK
ncbi:uncharacterized protein LOC122402287 [Colletes gigas]|uniref:uncharacterized protein LOC122402287 n=1 Tax=Colletes gigas TaxID=935657 RepID=UPI001C9B0B2B|nr:uncharacterized protein LOC122402287 [Colletes gigas]